MKTLTEAQLAAIRKLASCNPFRWKKQLRDFWAQTRVTTNDFEVTLYGLRNSHGPDWLVDFRLPKQVQR